MLGRKECGRGADGVRRGRGQVCCFGSGWCERVCAYTQKCDRHIRKLTRLVDGLSNKMILDVPFYVVTNLVRRFKSVVMIYDFGRDVLVNW